VLLFLVGKFGSMISVVVGETVVDNRGMLPLGDEVATMIEVVSAVVGLVGWVVGRKGGRDVVIVGDNDDEVVTTVVNGIGGNVVVVVKTIGGRVDVVGGNPMVNCMMLLLVVNSVVGWEATDGIGVADVDGLNTTGELAVEVMIIISILSLVIVVLGSDRDVDVVGVVTSIGGIIVVEARVVKDDGKFNVGKLVGAGDADAARVEVGPTDGSKGVTKEEDAGVTVGDDTVKVAAIGDKLESGLGSIRDWEELVFGVTRGDGGGKLDAVVRTACIADDDAGVDKV
jgi:hypothetical protein